MATGTTGGLENLHSIVDRSKSGIKELKNLKRKVYPEVRDVKIPLTVDSNPALYQSVKEIFGDIEPNEHGQIHITFDMYMDCVNLIRQAGKAKAASIIDRSL